MAEGILEWGATGLTICAAITTASNLGARYTGYGFAVFTGASLLWALSGWQSDQTTLLVTNSFLIFVNAFGIWRWLGRERLFEVSGKAAEKHSINQTTPTIVPTLNLLGREVQTQDGEKLGEVGEVLIERESGLINYVVVSSGHVPTPQLRAVAWSDIMIKDANVSVKIDASQFQELETLKEGEWPTAAPPAKQEMTPATA